MTIIISGETKKDYVQVDNLVQEAFADEEYSDHQEYLLIDRLRKSAAYIPELALLAKDGEDILGYCLFTIAHICREDSSFQTLALAPLAVRPEYQNQGVGRALVYHGLTLAAQMGYGSVIVMGHADYYPKFGFKPAHSFAINVSFDCPAECLMAIELSADSLDGIRGTLEYAPEFFV